MMQRPVLIPLVASALLVLALSPQASAQSGRFAPAMAQPLPQSLAPQPICGRSGRVEAGSYSLPASQRAAERAWTREVAAVLPAEFTQLSNADPQRSRGRCVDLGQGRWTCQLIATPCSRQSRQGPFRPW